MMISPVTLSLARFASLTVIRAAAHTLADHFTLGCCAEDISQWRATPAGNSRDIHPP
jgi:hypothetical protein